MSQIDPSQSLFDPPEPPPAPPSDPAPPPAPAAQDPATPPAWLGSVVAEVAGAIREGMRQDPATSAQAVPTGPATWWDSLNDDQRSKINEQSLLNAGQTTAYVAQQEAEFARRRIIQESAPLIASQGDMIAQMFKNAKRADRFFAQIEPIFDRKLQGIDLRPLVNMTQAVRERELGLYWDAAAGEVYRQVATNPPREPTLTAAGSAAPGPTGGTLSESDPFMAAMAKEYGFTDEQKRALEEANKS